MATMQWASAKERVVRGHYAVGFCQGMEKGEEWRGECVATMQWASVTDRTALPCEARPRAPATHSPLLPPPYSLLVKFFLDFSCEGV